MISSLGVVWRPFKSIWRSQFWHQDHDGGGAGKRGYLVAKNGHNTLISGWKINPIADLESTNEGLSNETNLSSVAQFVLEILAEEGGCIAQLYIMHYSDDGLFDW